MKKDELSFKSSYFRDSFKDVIDESFKKILTKHRISKSGRVIFDETL